MLIRNYKDTDKPSVITLLRRNTPEFFAPEEEDDLLFYLDNYAQNYFVVEIDNQIVGSGGYNIAEDGITAKISWDIIDSEAQGKGIGRSLTVYRIKDILKNKDIEILSVRTSQLAYKFYEKFGLKLREVSADYWAKGLDLYLLNCNIKSVKVK